MTGCAFLVLLFSIVPTFDPIKGTLPVVEPLPKGAIARLGNTKLRHASYVAAVAFSPNGYFLASGSNTNYGGSDGSLRIWDVKTGKLLRKCECEVTSLSWSKDGTRIATASRSGSIDVWDVETGKPVCSFKPETRGWAHGVAFSPTGNHVASVSGNSGVISLWDIESGKLWKKFETNARELCAVAWSPDGKLVAAAGTGQSKVTVWDVESAKLLHQINADYSHTEGSLAFSLDGKILVVRSRDGVNLIEPATGTSTGMVGKISSTTATASRFALSADGKMLGLSQVNQSLKLWDVEQDREIRSLPVHNGWPGGVAFSPDRKLIAWCGYGNAVRIWETDTGKALHEDRVHGQSIYDAGFNSNNEVFTNDGTYRVWDLDANGLKPGGRSGETPKNTVSNILAFSPDRKKIATGGWSGTAKIIDAETGKTLVELAANGKSFSTPKAVFTPDGKKLIVTQLDQRTIGLFDVESGKEIRQFTGHNDPVDAIVVSPDQTVMFTSGSERAYIRTPFKGYVPDKGIRVWEIETGKQLRELPGRCGAMTMTPDGKKLAVSADGGLSPTPFAILDPETGKATVTFQGFRLQPMRVLFTPDGKMLISVGRDKLVRIWNPNTGEEIRRLEGHQGDIYTVAISPDGKRLVTGGADGIAYIWDLQ